MATIISSIMNVAEQAYGFVQAYWIILAATVAIFAIGRAQFMKRVWDNPQRLQWLKFIVFYRKRPVRSFQKIGRPMQEHINRTLSDLAYTFLLECDSEQCISAHYPSNGKNRNVHQDMRELRRIGRRLHRAKRAFWLAHASAKSYGYSVKGSAKAYCTQDRFRDVREAAAPRFASVTV